MWPSIKSVNVIAHSMGNYPVLEVLSQRRAIARAGGRVADLKLGELVLAAPDISRAVLEQQAAVLKVLTRGGVTLCAPSKNVALIVSKEGSRGLIRAGDVPPTGPVFVTGIETIDISKDSSSWFGINHTTFSERKQVVEDMRLLLKNNLWPPHDRAKSLEITGRLPRQFWRYNDR